jgi:hypothetical protein
MKHRSNPETHSQPKAGIFHGLRKHPSFGAELVNQTMGNNAADVDQSGNQDAGDAGTILRHEDDRRMLKSSVMV